MKICCETTEVNCFYQSTQENWQEEMEKSTYKVH